MARNIYDVSPNGEKWTVKKRGATFASGTFDRKADAIEHGKTVAKANQPSQLVIHKADGTFETEYMYGNDPYPPPG
jgi:hypothetical protein